MSDELAGRVALITGGSKETGHAIAALLARRGARVIINYFHDQRAAAETVARLQAEQLPVEAIRASVSKPEQVQRMFAEIGETHGRLDILVNNAAYGVFRPFVELTERDWARMFDTNFHGARLCALGALPLMREHGGSIVNVSSTGASHVVGYYAGVGPSKAALEALTRYLAVEFGPYGIRVNTASLGLIDGASADRFPDSGQLREAFRRGSPFGRLATVDDLARIVGMLVGDDASWITGQTVVADGGVSSGYAAFAAPGYPPTPEQSTGSSGPATPPPPPAPAPTRTAAPEPTNPELLDPSSVVAIVGMGAALPGANSPDELWSLLTEGEPVFSLDENRFHVESFTSADPSAPDKARQGIGGYLRDFRPHPSLQAELAAGEIRGADEQTLWLRHASYQALESCARHSDQRYTVCVGLAPEGSLRLEESLVVANATRRLGELAGAPGTPSPAVAQEYPRAVGAVGGLSYRIAHSAVAGLVPAGSEILTVDAACASGLYAVDLGVQAILDGSCEVALCGGAFAVSERYLVLFDALGGLSPTGRVRSLDRNASGTLFSDGAAMVTLKRYDRAIADGDHVRGLIMGFGASSNGRGKAINASNVSGQRRAVQRAFETSGVEPSAVDWVVAHATGTRAGDIAELTTLTESIESAGQNANWLVTSNKSLLGHSGPAAGAVSVLHALLALDRGAIPPQRGFSGFPEGAGANLHVPTQEQQWVHDNDRPRTAAVGAYGFGGTNGLMLIQEPHRRVTTPPARRGNDSLVVVGWSAHLPNEPGREEVGAWLRGAPPSWPASFGPSYPVTGSRFRLTPRAVSTIDRSHVMAMQCGEALLTESDPGLAELRERMGVILAMVGPTRAHEENELRCHLDRWMAAAGRGEDAPPPADIARVAEDIRRDIPATNSESLSGMMANVAAGRVASHLDLHGLNLRVEAGLDTTLAAINVARRYLNAGHLDAVLLLAVDAMTSPSLVEAALGAQGAQRPIAEGAIGLALTTESVAREHGMAILAKLEAGVDAQPQPHRDGEPAWLGAGGAIEILRAITTAQPLDITPREDLGVAALRAVPTSPATDAPATQPAGEPAPDPSATTSPTAAPDTTRSDSVTRYRVARHARAGTTIREEVAALPPNAIVVTNSAEVAAQYRAGPVFVPEGAAAANAPAIAPGNLPHALAGAAMSAVSGLRIIADLAAPLDELLALHDLTFAAVQLFSPALPGKSCVLLGYNAWRGSALRATAGLLTGFVKSLAHEQGDCLIYGVVTDAAVHKGLELLTAESRLDRALPIAYYADGQRLVDEWTPSPARIAHAGLHLPEDPVILAVGGARGVTAALIRELLAHTNPKLWVWGSSQLDASDTVQLSGEEPRRADFIAAARSADPHASVASLTSQFDQLTRVREAEKNLREFRAQAGADRVEYRACDITDPRAVRACMDELLDREGRIDLLLQGAGVNRSASLAQKSLADFQHTRDVVVCGHENLRSALGDRTPRMWCNVGSIIGLVGQPGETDYGAAHGFLATAPEAAQLSGGRETTICWPHWRDTGLAKSPIWRERLAKRGLFTAIATKEAVPHFLAELAGDLADPCVVLIGETELRSDAAGWGLTEAGAGGLRVAQPSDTTSDGRAL